MSDFGLTVNGYTATHAYVQNDDAKPIRYLAPESLEKARYSEQSDVWAFGVLAWELLTDGKRPYFLIPDDGAVIANVLGGGRLPRPTAAQCPSDALWATVEGCWKSRKKDRPTFSSLLVQLGLAGDGVQGAGVSVDGSDATAAAAAQEATLQHQKAALEREKAALAEEKRQMQFEQQKAALAAEQRKVQLERERLAAQKKIAEEQRLAQEARDREAARENAAAQQRAAAEKARLAWDAYDGPTCTVNVVGAIPGQSQYEERDDMVGRLVISHKVTAIGAQAFERCRQLTSVDIGPSVTSIGSGAFNDCESLTSIMIGCKVKKIEDWAFNGCINLTTVSTPDSVTCIGSHAFYQCARLTSVFIPDSVTSIGSMAFMHCTALTSVSIPAAASIDDGSSSDGYCASFGEDCVISLR